MDKPSYRVQLIATAAMSVALGCATWVWNVDGFVTGTAYADDQQKLDQIIDLIITTDQNQNYIRRRESLDAEITATAHRIAELQLYIEADPNSTLTVARRANIRRLEARSDEARRLRDALDKMARQANLKHPQ